MNPVSTIQQNQWLGQITEIVTQRLHLAERQRVRASFSPELSYGRHFCPPGPTAKPAAVMVLLHLMEDQDGIDGTIPLTVRPNHLPDHPGQISFPGGRLEANESYMYAAVREFEEELGIDPFPGQIIGPLMPMWVFNSDYWLQPFLAFHVGELAFQPCPHEVERLLQLPIRKLLENEPCPAKQFSRGQVEWTANIFQLGDEIVWGATAVILAEVMAILKATGTACQF